MTPFDRLRAEILAIPGAQERPIHGIYDHSFSVGRRMIAHVHGRRQLHLTVAKAEARLLVASGKARPHSIQRLAAAGHVVLRFGTDEERALAVGLVRRIAGRLPRATAPVTRSAPSEGGQNDGPVVRGQNGGSTNS